ncbi:MAG: hypothetical protein ACJ741_14850 [Pyrinomonadaceae bacterium]
MMKRAEAEETLATEKKVLRDDADRSRITHVARVMALALAAVSSVAATARAASDESDVRGAVESAFSQLKGGDYGALYDALPSAAQKKIARASFVTSLQRSRGMYALDRLEIGAVHVAGDLAVVDSTVYGRALAPFEGDGKIVLRQYLLREGGRWRVTTGDRSTVQPLLAANPAFARRYPLTQPRLYVRRDNRWVPVEELMKNARRRGGGKQI